LSWRFNSWISRSAGISYRPLGRYPDRAPTGKLTTASQDTLRSQIRAQLDIRRHDLLAGIVHEYENTV
jgi:hypothetical protein